MANSIFQRYITPSSAIDFARKLEGAAEFMPDLDKAQALGAAMVLREQALLAMLHSACTLTAVITQAGNEQVVTIIGQERG